MYYIYHYRICICILRHGRTIYKLGNMEKLFQYRISSDVVDNF